MVCVGNLGLLRRRGDPNAVAWITNLYSVIYGISAMPYPHRTPHHRGVPDGAPILLYFARLSGAEQMILNTDWCFCPMEERFPLLSLRLHWFNPVTPMASHGTGATPTKQLNLIIRSAPGSFLGATANDALAAKTPASNAVR